MAYRNKKWYVVLLTGKTKVFGKEKQVGKGFTMAEASEMISKYLERPSFAYELENANAAFLEVYGREYASPAEMRTISDREEIARLKAQLEEMEIAKRNAAPPSPPDAGEKKNDEDLTGDKSKEDGGTDVLTKEQFAAAHPEIPAGLKVHQAYKKYLKGK
jgi:hypothetical protein